MGQVVSQFVQIFLGEDFRLFGVRTAGHGRQASIFAFYSPLWKLTIFFGFEMRDRTFLGGFIALSPGIFAALPLSINISRLQTGHIRRAARMTSIRDVILTWARQYGQVTRCS